MRHFRVHYTSSDEAHCFSSLHTSYSITAELVLPEQATEGQGRDGRGLQQRLSWLLQQLTALQQLVGSAWAQNTPSKNCHQPLCSQLGPPGLMANRFPARLNLPISSFAPVPLALCQLSSELCAPAAAPMAHGPVSNVHQTALPWGTAPCETSVTCETCVLSPTAQ